MPEYIFLASGLLFTIDSWLVAGINFHGRGGSDDGRWIHAVGVHVLADVCGSGVDTDPLSRSGVVRGHDASSVPRQGLPAFVVLEKRVHSVEHAPASLCARANGRVTTAPKLARPPISPGTTVGA